MLIHIHTYILQAFINAYITAVHTHMLQKETHSHMQHVNCFRGTNLP